jgi:hypothetical protein
MPIPRELLGISAATLPTHPVTASRLPADMAHRSHLASQLGGHLCFQQRFYHGFDRCSGCTFGLLVDFFQDGLPLVCFQFPLSKVSSHSADPSWWLSLVFFFTLPLGGLQPLCSAAFPPFSLPLERDTLPYHAIYQAGFLVQLDCPDLAVGMSGADEANLPFLHLHLQALNHAVRDIPPDRLRLHLCWGNYEGPHHRDVPLQNIIGEVLEARPVAVSFEGANPRHEHEWKVFEEIRLPEGKVIIPGVLDSTTNFIEHPELVAQRLERYASVVGRENVIAGTDCGFATFAGLLTVDPDITWAKLASMVEGARTATDRLW